MSAHGWKSPAPTIAERARRKIPPSAFSIQIRTNHYYIILNKRKMNKKELVSAMAEYAGTTKRQAAEMLEAFLSTVSKESSKGNKVAIPGFGRFEMKVTKPRKGVDPNNHQPITIPTRRKLVFKPFAHGHLYHMKY